MRGRGKGVDLIRLQSSFWAVRCLCSARGRDQREGPGNLVEAFSSSGVLKRNTDPY